LCIETRLLRRFAALYPVADGFIKMVLDSRSEFFLFASSPTE